MALLIKKMQLLTTIDQCKAKYKEAKVAYYNSTPVMSDAAFDKLEDHIRKIDPKWSEFKKTGVKVGKKVEVALAHFMPSLNKAYPEDMAKWGAKNPARRYVVMEKLDGSSVQLTYEGGKPTKLITRGDGVNGKDITFLIPYLNLPVGKAAPKGTAIFRCEAVMSQRIFEKKWAEKFENSRNLVNGLLNRQDVHPALTDVDIVVLGRYGASLRDGFGAATLMGLKTVNYGLVKFEEITPGLLTTMRKSSRYDMDGLVVAPEDFQLVYQNADKPKGIIAFKVNDEENAAEVKVKQIIWQVTGRGRIVPKVEIEPTRIDGVTIKHAAAHNAEWMMERGIGPGAVVKILRSGGVIPKIVDVVKKGKFQAPNIAYTTDGVHFVVSKAGTETEQRINVLNIVKFMKTLGIELIASKTAAELYGVGLQVPLDYIKAFGKGSLQGAINEVYPGVQGKKIFSEIASVFNCSVNMKKLMVASQVFGVGIGERKLEQIEAAGISMIKLNAQPKTLDGLLADVEGFSDKTINVLKKGKPEWDLFYKQASIYLTVDGSLPKKKAAVKGGKLYPLNVSFTGYRDKEQEAWVIAQGGNVIPFGSKTTILLYKEDGKASSKVDKARADGRMVMTFKQLEKHK